MQVHSIPDKISTPKQNVNLSIPVNDWVIFLGKSCTEKGIYLKISPSITECHLLTVL